MRKLSFVLSVALLTLPVAPAFADGVTITVTPWLAPNVFGSPSATQANANAAMAQYKQVSTYGAAGPTQFNAQSNITSAQGVVTGFSSWMGTAEAGGAYANELGNRQTFAVAVYGNGTKISLSELSYSVMSDDYYDAFAGGHSAGYYQYGQTSYGGAGGLGDYFGVIYNPDGSITYVTSGSNTQLVDAIFGSGSGSSFAAYCTGCTPAQEQQAIYDQAAYYPGSPYSITGTYSLLDATGSGTFNVTPYDQVAATPEPSSLVLLGTGFLGAAGVMRRRILGS